MSQVRSSASWTPLDPTLGELDVEERRLLVRRLADEVGAQVSRQVQDALAEGTEWSSDAEKVASSTHIQRVLRHENEARLRRGLEPLSSYAHRAIHDSVMAHVYGLGELEELWHHDDVENIDANGPFEVFVTFVGGRKVRWHPIAANGDEYLDLIRRIARRLGLIEVEFDARHPFLDLQLPDGSRLFAIYGGRGNSGCAVETYLCIRRHRFPNPTPDDLVRLGVWPQMVSDFVVAAFAAGENLIVSGDWGAGKTTALRTIALAAISPWERVLTVEAAITELGLARSGRLENVVETFSRPAGAEGEGEVTVADIIKKATRRLNPGRGIVGEILGDEVGPTLDMFTASTKGSACTIHARSARSALDRFEYYGRAATPPLDAEMIRRGLAEAAPIVVHLSADESVEGEVRRFCTSVVEVTGFEDGKLAATELWGLDEHGELVATNALSMSKRGRLARRGWTWLRDGWAGLLPTNGHLG